MYRTLTRSAHLFAAVALAPHADFASFAKTDPRLGTMIGGFDEDTGEIAPAVKKDVDSRRSSKAFATGTGTFEADDVGGNIRAGMARDLNHRSVNSVRPVGCKFRDRGTLPLIGEMHR